MPMVLPCDPWNQHVLYPYPLDPVTGLTLATDTQFCPLAFGQDFDRETTLWDREDSWVLNGRLAVGYFENQPTTRWQKRMAGVLVNLFRCCVGRLADNDPCSFYCEDIINPEFKYGHASVSVIVPKLYQFWHAFFDAYVKNKRTQCAQ